MNFITCKISVLFYFLATVKAVEPNAAIKRIENSIKDWLKLAFLRVSIAEARTLKTNLIKVTFHRFSLFR